MKKNCVLFFIIALAVSAYAQVNLLDARQFPAPGLKIIDVTMGKEPIVYYQGHPLPDSTGFTKLAYNNEAFAWHQWEPVEDAPFHRITKVYYNFIDPNALMILSGANYFTQATFVIDGQLKFYDVNIGIIENVTIDRANKLIQLTLNNRWNSSPHCEKVVLFF